MGTEISSLSWIVNSTHAVQYSILPGVNPTFPHTVNLAPSIPGVVVMIINASRESSGQDITSTISADASVLSGSSLQCVANNIIRNSSIQERKGENVIFLMAVQ